MSVRSHMDVTEVTKIVQTIGNVGNLDPERSHALEDELYRKVLEEVVAGNPSSPELAKAALASQAVEFPRWCA